MLLHDSLHPLGGGESVVDDGRAPAPFCPPKPDNQGVAAKLDDAAPVAVYLGDERREDRIQGAGQLFRAMIRLQALGQRLRQQRKARNVGDEGHAVARQRRTSHGGCRSAVEEYAIALAPWRC